MKLLIYKVLVVIISQFLMISRAYNYPKIFRRCQTFIKSSISSTFPITFDCYNESNRTINNLVKESDLNDNITVVNVKLVPKSMFAEWRNSVSNKSLDILKTLTGQAIQSFSGQYIVCLPQDDGTFPLIAFYNDDDAFSKKHFFSFDGYWKSFKANTTYKFTHMGARDINADIANKLAISFALSNYKFNWFNSATSSASSAKLIIPKECDEIYVKSMIRAYTLMRDLVNSPASSLGPSAIENTITALAKEYSASKIAVFRGVDDLVKNRFCQIAAVGMGATPDREPRLIDVSWESPASPTDPELVIIGKGVTFDTGGLNIKGISMKGMKRDMAGAAQAIALTMLLHSMKLPLRLRLLVPVAENSVSGTSLRPSDVIKARNGKTTEVTNTDAEGRLILADAISYACEANPSIIIDFATLTGAARAALGEDLPALFSNNDTEAMALWNISIQYDDPMWILPLWKPYSKKLKSSVADLVNSGDGPGAITAALYLKHFISAPKKTEESLARNKTEDEMSSDDLQDETNSKSSSEGNQESHEPIWFHVDFGATVNGRTEPQGMIATLEYLKNKFKLS